MFRFIDEKIFKLTDQLKGSTAFQQAMSPIDSLSDDLQGIINKSISILVPVIPCLIFFSLLASNLSLRVQQSQKNDLIELVNNIKEQKGEVLAAERLLLSSKPVTGQSDFQAILASAADKNQINSSQVKIISFTQEAVGTLSRSQVKINFENFSTRDLSRFLKQLAKFEKVKINGIDVRKFKETLKGKLDLIHYSKSINGGA